MFYVCSFHEKYANRNTCRRFRENENETSYPLKRVVITKLLPFNNLQSARNAVLCSNERALDKIINNFRTTRGVKRVCDPDPETASRSRHWGEYRKHAADGSVVPTVSGVLGQLYLVPY